MKDDFDQYDSWDYWRRESPTCPYCNHECDADELWDADDEEVTCFGCDNKFEVTAETIVKFTSKRIETEE